MLRLEYRPTCAEDGSGDETIIEKQDKSLGMKNKFSVKKKFLTLTPELRRSPINSVKMQCSNNDTSFSGLEYVKNKAYALYDTVELVSESISKERRHHRNFVDGLRREVIRLDGEVRDKSVRIEDLRLYTADRATMVRSLVAALDEARWKRDTMQRVCEEYERRYSSVDDDTFDDDTVVDDAVDDEAISVDAVDIDDDTIDDEPSREIASLLLVVAGAKVASGMVALGGRVDALRSCLVVCPEEQDLVVEPPHLRSLLGDLDECVAEAGRAAARADRLLADALLTDPTLDGPVKYVVRAARDLSSRPVDDDDRNNDDRAESAAETIDSLVAVTDSDDRPAVVSRLWRAAEQLFLRNRCLTNRIASLNVHKTGLRLELAEMEDCAKELRLDTITETELVEKKQETLDQNESMILQHWDELDTSQEIVVQTQRAQDIDQQLEEVQIEYDNHNEENRRLKNELDCYQMQLIEYQLKCEQLEKENKRMETEKNEFLEEYAMSWGHHNAKQKIKYTGRLIKDIDSITQEIKSLELEIEKQETQVDSNVRTPIFGKTQPKSEKTPRTFGVINTNKLQNTGVFRESVVRNLRY